MRTFRYRSSGVIGNAGNLYPSLVTNRETDHTPRRREGLLTIHGPGMAAGRAKAAATLQEKAMDENISAMSDPEFLTERRRVREAIEALQDQYAKLNAEFDRRATAKWKDDGRSRSAAR